MTALKTIIGIVLWIILGFLGFVAASLVGLGIGLIVKLYPWWLILVGTIAGMASIGLWVMEEEKKK